MKNIADIIYDNLCYAYCDNCRYHSEIDDESYCECCHRKYMDWAISRSAAEGIAHDIDKLLKPDMNKFSTGKPKVEGEYLLAVQGFVKKTFYCIGRWAEDLYEVSKYDFVDKRGVSGFYVYDSEWGYSSIDDILGWMFLDE